MKRTKTALQDLTAERCAAIAKSLRLSIAHFGLALNPTSPVSEIMRHLEWMGSFTAGPMMKGGAGESDRGRVVDVVAGVEQAERVAIALERVRGVKGAGAVVSCLHDNIDRLSTLYERAQDVLFEIEVGGRLAARGLPVAFAEPDIVLEFPGGHVGLPCKRPRSAAAIVRNLRDAAKQLDRSQLPGVAVLSVEPIVHPPARVGGVSANKPAPINWAADSQEEAESAADQMVRKAIEPLWPDIDRLFCRYPRLAGVVFCGVMTAWLKSPSAYVYRWLNYSLASPRDNQTPSLTTELGDLISGTHGQ